MKYILSIVFCHVTLVSALAALPKADPAATGLDAERLAQIDSIVADEIKSGRIPGAVVLVGRHQKLAFVKAYGDRRRVPATEAMTFDTIFDMASLTKPMATATAAMILIEEGKLRLTDTVKKHLPEWDNHGKGVITVDQLLRHRAGLIPDNSIRDYANGPDEAWKNLANLDLVGPPGELFRYSDVGFITLGRIVEKVSGMPLDQFTHERIFKPLGMNDSGFAPKDKPLPEALRKRTAPTEPVAGEMAWGQVHDPRSRALGGTAGHAGLFSSLEDVSIYARMMLGGGVGPNGRRLFSPLTVRLMIDAATTPENERRALGWDVQTSYSGPRGALMGPTSFGHTGFTGTSLWIDPETGLYVIILSSRLHPAGKGDASPVRYRVATAVASALIDAPIQAPALKSVGTGGKPSGPERKLRVTPGQTLTGIDVLKLAGFEPLKGKKVALVTNHTGLDRDGNATIDLLHKAPEVRLVALFSPEHGIRGAVDKEVGDSKDEKTGLPIFSLYGKTRKPSAGQLKDVDLIVYDIQDIGVRFYTYLSTLALVMEAAAENGKPLYLMDRPNPIRADRFGGIMRDRDKRTFVADHDIPVVSGLTIAEYARLIKAERNLKTDLHIIECKNYDRRMYWDETGLVWTNPSPNMRSLTEALLYPGVGLLEATNLATGRGTDTPFERVGAPWINAKAWAGALNQLHLTGVVFIPVSFSPTERQFAKEKCNGVYIQVTSRDLVNGVDIGLAMAATLKKLYPSEWKPEKMNVICVNQKLVDAVTRGATLRQLKAIAAEGLADYADRRKKALIYPE
ncbi:MAG: exo-beta-N-acetylmuramidase NamZ domain-containing protein [bacterium]